MRTWVAAAVAVALVGVTAAVPSASAQQQLLDGNPATTERLAAADVVASAVAASGLRFGAAAAEHAVLVTTRDFADALAASSLHDEILRAVGRGRVYLLGGTAAIGAGVEQQLRDGGFDVVRLAGPTRVETAIAVADEVRARYGARDRVVLARAFGTAADPSAGWADSVTGGAYAAAHDLPVLVTPSESLAPAVADALARYAPTSTVLLGGTAALSAQVEASVPGPVRVAGGDRAATAAEVAAQLFGASPGYLLFNGYAADGWAWALPAAGLAADLATPLLVTDVGSAPPATLARVGVGCGTGPARVETAVIGSAAVVSDAVIAQVDTHDGGVCPPPDDLEIARQLAPRGVELFGDCPPPPSNPLVPAWAVCVSVVSAPLDADGDLDDRLILYQDGDRNRWALFVPSTTRRAQTLTIGQTFIGSASQASYAVDCVVDVDGDGDAEVLMWDDFGANTGYGYVLDITRDDAPTGYIVADPSAAFTNGRYAWYVGGAYRHGSGYRLPGGGILREVYWEMHDDNAGFRWFERDVRFLGGTAYLVGERSGDVREADIDRLHQRARPWSGSGCPGGGSGL